MVGGGVPEKGAGVIWCRDVPVGQSSRSYKWTGAHSYVSRACDLFLQLKSIKFCTLELVHQVGEFTVSKGGVRASE